MIMLDSREYEGTEPDIDDNDSQLICDLKDKIVDLEEFANECIRILVDVEPKFNAALHDEAKRLGLAKWL